MQTVLQISIHIMQMIVYPIIHIHARVYALCIDVCLRILTYTYTEYLTINDTTLMYKQRADQSEQESATILQILQQLLKNLLNNTSEIKCEKLYVKHCKQIFIQDILNFDNLLTTDNELCTFIVQCYTSPVVIKNNCE